jgi:hypothetical protein
VRDDDLAPGRQRLYAAALCKRRAALLFSTVKGEEMSGSNVTAERGQDTLVVLLHAYQQRATSLMSIEKTVLSLWPKAHL